MKVSRLVMIWLSVQSANAYAIKVGDQLPKIQVLDGSGKQVEPWVGKKTLINFWATWCDACKVELSEMKNEVAKAPKDRAVVFVSLDKETVKAKDFFDAKFKSDAAMTAALHFDPSFKLADSLNVESFPMTLVVDEKGKVVKIQEGFKEGSGTTEALFNELRK
jgi:peroxiredoxin